MPALGISLILIAAGAILAFAITADTNSAVSLDAIGVILMVVGGLGLMMSLLFLMSFSPFARGEVVTRDHVDHHI